MKRVGILTSGGDCQALNATMRGVAKGLYSLYGADGVEIIGFLEGYKGMIYEKYRRMAPRDFTGLLTVGGTILGSSRTPFKLIREPDRNGLDKVKAMKDTYKKLKLDCLVVLGGNGSQKTANLLNEEGLNVIGLPKTIDNDLWGTDTTFGFQSAIATATNVIDCIHTTAASHNRIFIVEVMGHKVGWLTLNAGIAGGADIILIPEIPYKLKSVIGKIQERGKTGHDLAISKERADMPKKERKKSLEELAASYPSVSYELAAQITEATGKDVRVTVPGHMQRGGMPCAYDRVLSSRLGAQAALNIYEEKYGDLVAIQNHKIVSVPLKEIAGKLKTVDPKGDIIAEARLLGISFGDE